MLTLDDVDVIVELDEIAGRIENAVKVIVDKDWFEIDGKFFKKPTFAREQLIQRIREAYPSGRFDVAGVLYALDLNRTEAEIQSVPSRARLLKYVLTLDIGISKAVSKIEEVFGLTEDADEPSEPFDPWHLCAVLSREIGGTPDDWFDASPQKIKGAIRAHEEKIEAESKAMGVASGPPRETPKLLAIVEFRDKIKALEASWLAVA
jgi:hypothetical protein